MYVCGLTSKLQSPDFMSLISSNDILIATETKTDNADIPNVDIPNYTVHVKNHSKFKHESGGVDILKIL